MDGESVKWAIGQGGLAVAFLVLFHFYRKDVQQFTELWRAVSDEMILVVKENTAAAARMAVLIDTMHRRLDEANCPFLPPDPRAKGRPPGERDG